MYGSVNGAFGDGLQVKWNRLTNSLVDGATEFLTAISCFRVMRTIRSMLDLQKENFGELIALMMWLILDAS